MVMVKRGSMEVVVMRGDDEDGEEKRYSGNSGNRKGGEIYNIREKEEKEKEKEKDNEEMYEKI